MMQIPNNVEDAVLGLKGLGELMVASEWQRAALVWAFTYEGKNQNPACKDVYKRSLSDFAKLEIAGLSSRPTLGKYRKAWALAIQNGIATDVKPGDLIDLPDAEWHPYFNPPRQKKNTEVAKRNKLPTWDETTWDAEKVGNSQRLVKMSEVMEDLMAGVEDEKLSRIGQSILDFVGDENKARGLARMMHAVIEFTSEYQRR